MRIFQRGGTKLRQEPRPANRGQETLDLFVFWEKFIPKHLFGLVLRELFHIFQLALNRSGIAPNRVQMVGSSLEAF